jgi:nicotinamide-nucleotide amidase
MQAVVLSVGNELLRGDIVDSNATFLTRELTQLGFEVVFVKQVGDNLETLREAFRQSVQSSQVVVSTGGLGPTEDDVTRQAIAAMEDEEPTVDPTMLKELQSRFASTRRIMPKSNEQQATLIPSAKSVSNPNGTAPGWLVRKNGHVIVAMPGPPSEMQPMWRESVKPEIIKLSDGHIALASLMTFGLGESSLEERIRDLIHSRSEVTIATYAKSSGVEVHVTVRSTSSQEASELLAQTETALRDRLGEAIFGTGEQTLAAVTGHLLEKRGWWLAVMESATGGELSSIITNNPGSSSHFRGGIVAYAPDAKVKYGVDQETIDKHGLISAEIALSLASVARNQLSADVGIGVTGIAGTEPVEGKPSGTVFIGLKTDECEEVREIHRPGHRETVKRFAALSALDMLRLNLQRSLAGSTPVEA